MEYALAHDVHTYIHVGHGCGVYKSVSLSRAMSIFVFNNITASFLQPSTTSHYVPVPDRNRILFHRILEAHYYYVAYFKHITEFDFDAL